MIFLLYVIKSIRSVLIYLVVFFSLQKSPVLGTMSEGVRERFASTLNKESSGPHPHGRGFLMVVEQFHRRAKTWEIIHNRSLSEIDLLLPFISFKEGILCFRALDKKYFSGDYFSPTLCRSIVIMFHKWDYYMQCFSSNVYSYRPGGRHRYDDLFILQYEIEKCRFIGEDSYLKSILRRNKKVRPFLQRMGIDQLKFNFSKDFVIQPKPRVTSRSLMKETKKKTIITSLTRVTGCTGVPPDPPIFIDSIASKVKRFVMRQEPPSKPVSPELPRTLRFDFWRYTHEARGIGFTVFMYLFPALRDQCIGFEAYGMGRDVIGDSLYNELTRPFVQPPYELPVSVFEEEAAMMADSGGAAAAAASSSGTDTHESRALTSSSRPAAAAAASCADLPDESDDSRETDRLLGGTGPYVRHRTAAMAAAAAVEEELGTSTT